MSADYAVTMQVAKAAIDVVVLERLRHPPAHVPRDHAGTFADATYRLRWVRPALTFPDDLVDMVRIGLGIEGGVHLANGRILSCAAFVTASAKPGCTRDESGWFLRLSLTDIQIGDLVYTYAGKVLDDKQSAVTGGIDLAGLRVAMRDTITQFCAEFPDVPLTYAFPNTAITADDITVHVLSETNGAAITIALGVDRPATGLRVTPLRNLALVLDAPTITTAFAEVVEAAPLPVPVASVSVALAAETLDFTVMLDDAETSVLTLSAHPRIDDGEWLLEFVPRDDGTELPDDLYNVLSHLSRVALQHALVALIGTDEGVLAWTWQAPRVATPFAVTFIPATVSVFAQSLALIGSLPFDTGVDEPVEDSMSFVLEQVSDLTERPEVASLEATLHVARLHNVTPPLDYVWQTLPTSAVQEEHGETLTLRLPDMSTSANDTLPKKTRPLPRDMMRVTATVIDAFGCFAQAESELHTTPDGIIATDVPFFDEDVAYPPRRMTPLAPTPTTFTRGALPNANGAQTHSTVVGTRPVAPLKSNGVAVQTIFASALVMLALFALGVAVLLAHGVATPVAAASPTTNIRLTPQITVLPTTLVTVTPAVTATLGASVTATAIPFGRFAPVAGMSALQFICATDGTTPPATLSFANSGTATLSWQAHIIDTLAGTNQAWAVVSPSSGTLGTQTTDIAMLTVTPASGFCVAPATGTYRLQLTGANTVPLTLTATHSPVATTPTPTASPTIPPTVTPTATPHP